MIELNEANLGQLPQGVGRPAYDRSKLSAGIVHFGVGNFHRAHQAVYLDELINDGRDHDWAIVGAGVRPGDRAVRDALARPGLADHRGRAGGRALDRARDRRR